MSFAHQMLPDGLKRRAIFFLSLALGYETETQPQQPRCRNFFRSVPGLQGAGIQPYK